MHGADPESDGSVPVLCETRVFWIHKEIRAIVLWIGVIALRKSRRRKFDHWGHGSGDGEKRTAWRRLPEKSVLSLEAENRFR